MEVNTFKISTERAKEILSEASYNRMMTFNEEWYEAVKMGLTAIILLEKLVAKGSKFSVN